MPHELQPLAPSAIMRAVISIRVRRVLAAVALCLLAVPSPVHAERERWSRNEGSRPALAPHSTAQRRVSLEEAIDSVQRSTGGRVLDARDMGERYRIKVLTRRGEVRVVYVDARTGEMR
jgi:hypothetical protein